MQNISDLLIECFCLTASLRIVGTRDVMHGPKFLEETWEAASMECDSPSLITILDVPNFGKIISWNILQVCLTSTVLHGMISIYLKT